MAASCSLPPQDGRFVRSACTATRSHLCASGSLDFVQRTSSSRSTANIWITLSCSKKGQRIEDGLPGTNTRSSKLATLFSPLPSLVRKLRLGTPPLLRSSASSDFPHNHNITDRWTNPAYKLSPFPSCTGERTCLRSYTSPDLATRQRVCYKHSRINSASRRYPASNVALPRASSALAFAAAFGSFPVNSSASPYTTGGAPSTRR